MPATVAFKTLGCRLNQAESDSMAEQLTGRGMSIAIGEDEPDLVVVNTCTVTREATKASRMAIRRAVRDNPNARVVVVGCYAVSDPDEVAAIEGVDVIVGNDEKDAFAEALTQRSPTAPLLQIGMRQVAAELPHRVRANLKVQTGCDEWCTFCIIPKTRGPLKSLDAEDLVAEARAKVAAGARELVLTGVHLGKYSFDQGGDERALVGLLRRLLDIEGVWRLRLSSILSRHLTDELLELMGNDERICRHLHVPLQSGDDDVLEAMHRPYRIDDYAEAVKRAYSELSGLALATDIIVGFPTESDAAFQNTMRVVEDLRFSKLHVFRYSPRGDTAAAALTDAVSPAVKKERSKALIDLGNEMRRDFLAAHVGPSLEVLVEDERSVEGVTVCSGQTQDYVRVWFEGANLLGKLVNVVGHEMRADGIRGAELLGVGRG